MKRNHRGAKPRRQILKVWSYQQIKGAIPYIASIVRSLREHWLEMQRHQQILTRLESQPGRSSRHDIIAQDEARRDVEQATNRFEEALQELQTLDVYCLDPNRGEALIPFVHGEQLAWYVFDL